MDPTPAPWRALEDAPIEASGGPEPTAGPGRLPRSAILGGGGALLLAIAAFVLAFGSNAGGNVSVDAKTPLASDPSGVGFGPASSDQPVDGAGGPVLVVEIVGAIENPGVYRLPAGARIGDLVDRAGGYSPRVDTDRAGLELNLAAPVHDGDQVRVPSRDDPATGLGGPGKGSPGGTSGPSVVDLNHATAAELDALPGIGPVTSAKIIASRDEQPFRAVDDLRTRKLVGEKTFASLKDLVAVH